MADTKSNKAVLITGGSRGIGRAIAIHAAKAGYDIIFSYRTNLDAATSIYDELHALGAKAHGVQADVSTEAGVIRLFQFADEATGRLDALVNNAGNVAPSSRVDSFSAARVSDLLALNVLGPILCCREAVKRMSTLYGGRGGNIVNISSIAASLGSPGEYVDYAATKAAIDTLTKGLAKEVANEGIRVNAVRPGIIDTDLHANSGDRERPFKLQSLIPMQKVGSVDDIAQAVLWLLSDEASYITGSLLDVSGGR
ncbi:SDR family oxidoreductase [Saccharophagus degradans]|uniref:SDR family oxidoreductase n=1 Tax=Saccharophagus degradans TaxID=86304 RepID=A0AAW7XAY3_9GAMM|nr:SDR family oxidoreductase [Saccharophagus degradans]MDO6423673.1 SDR family oxidoreductase [Saccharophagus degradans]MDO6607656.1 SDR family oxidoreductase [Saccharophagus degradans]